MRNFPLNFWSVQLKKRRVRLAIFLGLLILIFVAWPTPEPDYHYSTIVNDTKGSLLSAAVARDSQWRFPPADSVPSKVQTSIRFFEDEYYYLHPGINPVSIVRAAWQNATKGEIFSGASTLTMQIARMMGNNRRTVWNKLGEMVLAIKLELKYSKEELMIKYASMAPFGGNVVGLEAASWRYYGRAPHLLSWGEAATLAVLPNNPGAIFPGTQDSVLIKKRNRLLLKLHRKGVFDQQTYELAKAEPVPDKPLPIPNQAQHLLTTYAQTNEGQRLQSTLDPYWQSRVSSMVENHHLMLTGNGIENLSALVVDLEDGAVLAYKGNTDDITTDGYHVDVLQRPRSPGSSLKPFLYAAAIDKGLINYKTLLPDVPSFFGGFSPKNFNHGFSGVVPANQALSRSLNIPLVHLLQQYSYEQFYQDLNHWGITTLKQPAGHYGLTLILGGCEVTPWELAQLYFSFYRKMAGENNVSIHFDQEVQERPAISIEQDAIWRTFQTMTTLARPEGERAWRTFTSSQFISWKTGTSHGFRDAWAIGINGNVLVLVWVGNADGEGRAELTGIKAASPLMHSILRLSPNNREWLQNLKPVMAKTDVCGVSGMLANDYCPKQKVEITKNGLLSGLCSFHENYILDNTGTYRVTSDCYSLTETVHKSHFVLPATMGYYYGLEMADYTGLPPWHPDCEGVSQPIGIVYPNLNSRVFIPKEITGEAGRAVFRATHQVSGVELFWHIDEVFYGKTKDDHQLAVWLPYGSHLLTVMDAEGNKLSRTFDVVSTNR